MIHVLVHCIGKLNLYPHHLKHKLNWIAWMIAFINVLNVYIWMRDVCTVRQWLIPKCSYKTHLLCFVYKFYSLRSTPWGWTWVFCLHRNLNCLSLMPIFNVNADEIQILCTERCANPLESQHMQRPDPCSYFVYIHIEREYKRINKQ